MVVKLAIDVHVVVMYLDKLVINQNDLNVIHVWQYILVSKRL